MQSARTTTFGLLAVAAALFISGAAAASPLALPDIVQAAILSSGVRIATPPDGATVDGSAAVVVEFDLAGGRSAAKVELYVDTEMYAANPIRSGTGRGKTVFYLDTTRFGNGEHTLSAVVYDAESYSWYTLSGVQIHNVEDEGFLDGTRRQGSDLLEPTADIVRPSEGSVLSGVVDILVAAEDNACTPTVTIFVDKTIKAMSNRPPYTWTWDTRLYADGQHLVEAWAHDDSRNRGVADPVSVVVANANPLTGAEDVLDPGEVGEETGEEIAAATTPMVVSGPPVVAQIRGGAQGYRLAPGVEAASASFSSPLTTVPAAAAVAAPAKEEPRVAAPPLTNPLRLGYQGLAGAHVGSRQRAQGAGPQAVVPTIAERTPEPPVTTVVTAEKTPQGPESEPVEIASTPQTVVGPAVAAGPRVSPRIPLAGLNVSGPEAAGPVTVRPRAPGVVATSKSGPPKKEGEGVEVTKLTGHVVGTPGPRVLDSLFVIFDDTMIDFDVKPTVKEGMAVAPFRHIFEHTGGTVDWIHELKIVNARNENVEIEIKIGRDFALVNQDELWMQLTPYITSGRTMVPLTFIRDALGLKMDYDPSTGKVYLSSQ